MRRYLLCLSAAIVCSTIVWAVTASPEPFPYTKADGTVVMARMFGDEFHSYIESLDGELLYGNKDPEELEEAAQVRRARRIQQAAGSSVFPTTGSPHSLVLLVSFADLDMGETLQDFRDLLVKSGYNYNGATGSCRDYYIASSDSIFLPQFDCFGPYKLSRNMEYYGKNEGKSKSAHAADMVAEACQMAHSDGVNFKEYDTNNDGILDNVFIFYAGHNEAEGGGENTIWPHASNISYLNVKLDGVVVGSYACTSEYKGSGGSVRCGIGTFCHEFGHVIGQPDFYDTDYNYYTVGNWDIMSNGSYNNNGNTPPTFSAYERMYEGWLTPKQLELPGQYTLSDVPFKKEAYLIAASEHNLSGTNPNPKEFFLLDYRSGANTWDLYLPGKGMLVWHIDYSASAWTSNTPNNGPTIMRMHLEEANGVTWKQRNRSENGRPSDPYPGTSKVTSFTPVLHDGTKLVQQPVFNIVEAGGVIGFTYIGSSGTTLQTTKSRLDFVTTISDTKKIVDWEPQSFELLGTGLDPEQGINLKPTSTHFLVYAGDEAPELNSSKWLYNTTVYPRADSTIQQRVWVSYNPKKRNCSIVDATLSAVSVGASAAIELTGYAPRPTYVHTPEIKATKNITPYAFTARWKEVNDAELYYLTLYQTEEGQSVYVQDFEKFTSMESIHDMGWESNTTLTTTSAKADGSRSLYFKKHGDQITSETYPVPVTTIEFWYNAFTSSVDTIGVLEIEAYNGEEWILEQRLVMTKNSKRVTTHYNFDTVANYRAFRLTWLDNGGAGIAFDAFTAITSQKINYIYKGKDLSVNPSGEEIISYNINSLNPNNTYFYQVQCTDLDKGCEEHLTDLSDPVKVQTLNGKPIDSKQLTLAYDSINYNPAQHAVYLLDPQNGDYLYFYNTAGRFVYSIPVNTNVSIYTLPLHLFTKGEIYMLQHAKNGKLSRKNKWVKFVF